MKVYVVVGPIFTYEIGPVGVFESLEDAEKFLLENDNALPGDEYSHYRIDDFVVVPKGGKYKIGNDGTTFYVDNND